MLSPMSMAQFRIELNHSGRAGLSRLTLQAKNAGKLNQRLREAHGDRRESAAFLPEIDPQSAVLTYFHCNHFNVSDQEHAVEACQGEITLLLRRWSVGDLSAFDALMPVVYPRLRQIAANFMRRERNPGTLQATAPVHEFYLKLLDRRSVNWEDRRHFFNFAAHAMRMILIDQARQAQAPMHGGGLERVPLDEEIAWAPVGSPEFLDLNRAIDELNAISPDKVRMLELRYLLGCTAEETAELT